jgi:Periplasmic copper-binding protein (NosD)
MKLLRGGNGNLRLAGALLVPPLVVGALAAQAGAASAAPAWNGHQNVLYVSQSGNPHNSGRSCRSATFTSIQSAVNAAPSWATVVACPGTYYEQVVISKPLTLAGKRATISEKGVTPGFSVTIPGVGTETIFAAVVIVSSHVKVTGLTIRDAEGEGILAAGLGQGVSGIKISHNAVVHNDLGSIPGSKSTYFECAAMGEVPGDCGEGVHFAGNVSYSTIAGNFIARNSGGVLLSDDVGPTHNNVVENNIVTDNTLDCGITVPGHNPEAITPSGQLQPAVAGVYANVIKHNVVTGNGVKGEGAGVLFANGGPGTASYDNLVVGNYIAGNGLSGVTMHAHTIPPSSPNQHEYLNNNVVIGNVIGKNNIDGDTLDGPPVTDPVTTGVLVFSGGTHVMTRIAHNKISNNEIGIWLSKVVNASGLSTNKFFNVTTPISPNN